ncbi:ParB/Sulfiredoxin [Pyronema omphalodes]|nr:ParB/Sulfiredoxin [Pyronema omphalodes]
MPPNQPPNTPLWGSLQSRSLKPQSLPLSSLIRPIPPVLDHQKVDSMVCTLRGSASASVSNPADTPGDTSAVTSGTNTASTDTPTDINQGQLPPVDVLHYHSKTQQKDFYFVFGGCHRMKAYEIAGKDMVDCKVLKVTRAMLGVYLGASVGVVIGEE